MLVCYTQVIPTLPFDSDDWELLNTARSGLPSLAAFNLARVLPETLMPCAGYLAAYLIRPVVGDYLNALMLAAALLTASMVAIYVTLFYRLLTHQAGLGRFASLTATLVFFIAHFTVLLRTPDETGIPVLPGSFNYTCFFYYVIPSLLCARLVMTLMQQGGSFDAYGGLDRPGPRLSALVVALYLGVFSNLFSSYVLAAWCGGRLIDEDILRQVQEADEAGETYLLLHVPAWPESDVNWPQSNYMGQPLSLTLYKHKQITHGMVIECDIDAAMTERYLPERAQQ